MPQHRTQSKTTCLLKKKVAEGHLLKYKTCTQRLNFQRIQDLPQLINKKPTQYTKQNHMLIKKEGDRRPPSKVQDMPSTTKPTKKTRHAPTDEQEINTEHEATLHVYLKWRWSKATFQSTRHAAGRHTLGRIGSIVTAGRHTLGLLGHHSHVSCGTLGWNVLAT